MSAAAGYSVLDSPVQFLKGVGPKRAEQLGRLGILTARDLVYHVPRRYEDASTVTRIGALEVGMEATAIGEIISKGVIPTRSGLRIFQAVLRDESGLIECSWPGQPFLDRVLRKGDILLVTGPVKFFHGRQLQPREHVVLGQAGSDGDVSGKVLPLYPSTEGVTQRIFRGILESNLDPLLRAVEEEEIFPRAQLEGAGVPPLGQALTWLHRPASIHEAERGRRRLAFEELFFLQLLHARAHFLATESRRGQPMERSDTLVAQLYNRLPFELTGAQTRVIREVFADMASPQRMSRLVQGDVGSGKTVVALFAMLLAAENGFQSALMAPTEILAEQHARTLRKLLGDMPVEVVLLTGRLGAAERRDALARIGSGAAAIAVGTHALIQESVQFKRLGLAVVDEQHRFGVRQRAALAEMGERPDALVMSATPIPRSLALTVHGDLDLSVLDELPPGRQPIRTAIRRAESRGKIYQFLRSELEAGRQAYVVYPLVEESDKVELRAATAEFERLSREVFPDLVLGLIHGQMPGEEKDATMRAFAAGEIQLLVSTTVIEVGIDVANATVMVIEHAERFGLSQLHQLRGRVGRGAGESYCILVGEGDPTALERLRIFVDCSDGFEIAREDLRLRGMGDFFGARQHGLPEFRFFDAEKDEALLLRARGDARTVIEADPELRRPEHERFRDVLVRRYGERARLYQIG